MENLKNLLGENFRANEPMRIHTSLKTGGNADYFISPETEEELSAALEILRDQAVPVTVLGNCTNVIVSDRGIEGAAVSLLKLRSLYAQGDCVIVSSCGTLMSEAAVFALDCSLSGLEFAHGIPGSIGGGVIMNAGAYDGEMSGAVRSVRYLDKDNNIAELSGEQMNFAYRSSILQSSEAVVLSAEFLLREGNREDIIKKMKDFAERRKEKQPLEYPSAGSIFKRPEGHFTGELIEKSGLKGFRCGGMAVSTKHAGFIINIGNGTSDDIINLIGIIKDTVREKFGVLLSAEVKFIGRE